MNWERQQLCVCEEGGGKSENGTPEESQETSVTGGESPRHTCDPRAWKGRPDWATPSREGRSDGKESACNAETRVQALHREDALEKAAAAHSSILAWRILWTEEPTGL